MTPCAPGRENIVIRTERALEFRIWYDSGQSIVNENVPRKPKHTFSPAVHEEEKRPKNWKFFVATQNGSTDQSIDQLLERHIFSLDKLRKPTNQID